MICLGNATGRLYTSIPSFRQNELNKSRCAPGIDSLPQEPKRPLASQPGLLLKVRIIDPL